jgi:hypothetical protein
MRVSPESGSGRSPAATSVAMLLLLLAPLVYVGTWPLVEILGYGTVARNVASDMPVTLTRPAPWTKSVYRPLRVISKKDWGSRLGEYWLWWGKIFDAPPPMWMFFPELSPRDAYRTID